jgi:tetratricopeptide (TPR) repeat protein/predicted Ser/Thr protein kinase
MGDEDRAGVLAPGQALSHYRILEKLGEGGMGAVWKAEDTLLRRTVAIKVLLPDAARDERRRRMFLEEARLASSLSDAHIAQVHDLGRAGDLDFIVMEYVAGKPLRALVRGRPLPPDRVVTLGAQVAAALSRAHRKGLLHRDLKPENIIVSAEGDAKVVDFGLATLFDRPDTGSAFHVSTMTATEGGEDSTTRDDGGGPARIVGTLPYMSPEQSRGDDLDARSDVFSFGVVLYELATGRRPFWGATNTDLVREIQRARPTPPREVVPKLPLELDRIIVKALAPHRGDRYQTMEDLAVDLKRLGRDLESGSSPTGEDLKEAPAARRRMALAAAGALLAAAAIVVAWRTDFRRWKSGNSRTILILPLEVRGQSEGADYLGRAFAEALAVILAQEKELTLLPVPGTGEAIGGSVLDRAPAARDLGAGHLVSGALTRAGPSVHASLSLVDTRKNRIVWGAQKDAGGDALPDLAASLAREIAAHLGVRPARRYEHPLSVTGSPEMASSSDFTEAIAALRGEDTPAALAATARLIAAFPAVPEARVLRVRALGNAANNMHPSSPERKALDAELAVLGRLDPESPWPEFYRAYFAMVDGRSQEGAERLTRLLSRGDLAPAVRRFLLNQRAQAYANLDRLDLTWTDLEESLRLDPASPYTFSMYAFILANRGRFEEALIRIRQSIALHPDSTETQSSLGWILYGLKRWEEALVPLEASCRLNSEQWVCAMHAKALHRTGRAREAREAADHAAGLRENHAGAWEIATYWAIAGDNAAALRWLRRAVDLGYRPTRPEIDLMADNPDFAPLLGDPRFKAFIAEVEAPPR